MTHARQAMRSSGSAPPEQTGFDVVREADRIVLRRHGPAGVLVNDDLEIPQFRGDVSAYLSPTPGRASLNLVRMAREGLAGELQSAIGEARDKSDPIEQRGTAVHE